MKKDNKELNFEDLNVQEDRMRVKAVQRFSAVNGEGSIVKLMKKKYAEDIMNSVGAVMFSVKTKDKKTHYVKGELNNIFYNNRTGGCVYETLTTIDGARKTERIKYDYEFNNADGHMVYEVLDIVIDRLARDAFYRAVELENCGTLKAEIDF